MRHSTLATADRPHRHHTGRRASKVSSSLLPLPRRRGPVLAAAPASPGSSASAGKPSGTASTNGLPEKCDFDVLVIGGGSAGVRTARTAAELGARVALVELPLAFVSSDEKGGIGGTCVLRGCVPKKLMVYASTFATELEASKGFGWVDQSAGRLDWPAFMQAKRAELLRLSRAYTDGLKRAGVVLVEGRGKLLGPHTVDVDGRSYTARNIVIATGGQSSRINIPGAAEHAITSDKVLELEALPKVVTLVGGGYIAMEFAGMLARLGCEVHVIARQQLPLAPRFDEEVCRFFMQECEVFAGIRMHMRASPTAIIKEPDGSLTVKLEHKAPAGDAAAAAAQPDVSEIRGNDQVVLAVGRAGKTAGIGLEEAGVELGPKGSIKVDAYSRTNIPSIWAVGDVTSRIALTPVAIMEGAALGRSLVAAMQATGELEAPCYDAVPSACFSWPFVATVGLTEQQAVQQGRSFEVFTKTFTPLKASMVARGAAAADDDDGKGGTSADNHSRGTEKGFAKLLVESGSGRLLGLHLVGEDAPEIAQGFALAIKLGATKKELDSLVGIHPTAAEELLGLQGPDRTVTPAVTASNDGDDDGASAAAAGFSSAAGKAVEHRA